MPLLSKVRSLLQNLLASRQVDTDLNEEIRAHLDLLIEEKLRAGMAAEEAQRAARIELGGIEQVKEQVRERRLGNWLQSVLSDCHFAFRQLRKSPGFTAVAILTLALGVGANTAVFSILDAALIRPLPYPHPERLVKADVYDLKSGDLVGKTSYPDFEDWSQQNRSFDHLAAYEDKSFNLAGTFQPEHVKGQVVSADFFETLGVQPYRGRTFANVQNQQVAVLSYSLWSRSFASDPFAIGKSITLDGYSYKVTGVMPPGFQFPDRQTELWVLITPVRPDLREEITARGNLEMSVVGRLSANVSLSQAQARMAVVAAGLAQKYPDADRDLGVKLIPLQEATFGKFRPALFILMGSAAVVLLIACANIGTLLLARSSTRELEIAIRSSLGASRIRIFSQLLMESLLLAALGGALGALLAFFLTGVLAVWLPADIQRVSARVDLAVLSFTAVVSLLAGIFFGLTPAWKISHGETNASMKRANRGMERHRVTTRALVVVEIALSLVLLTSAGLLAKSLLLLGRVDPGFRTDHLLTIEVYRSMTDENRDANWRNWTRFCQRLLARVQTLPGVDSAGATLALPIEGRTWTVGFKIDGQSSGSWNDQRQAEARIVSNNYFDVMKIPLRGGRYFSEQDTKDSPHVAIINESVARLYWPSEDPLGRFIEMAAFGAGRCEIVGVVADVRQSNWSSDPSPAIYIPYTQEIMPWQTLVVRTKIDPMRLAEPIRREVAALDPEQPVARIATLDQLIEGSAAQPRFRTFLLVSFAGIALLLSSVGIYGVMAYVVSRRTREIGVRMAVGARPIDILKLVFGQSMTMTLLGLAFGLAGACAATRIMKNLLFGVTSTDPFTFAAAALLFCSVAFLATYIPARRASRVEPMVALRYE